MFVPAHAFVCLLWACVRACAFVTVCEHTCVIYIRCCIYVRARVRLLFAYKVRSIGWHMRKYIIYHLWACCCMPAWCAHDAHVNAMHLRKRIVHGFSMLKWCNLDVEGYRRRALRRKCLERTSFPRPSAFQQKCEVTIN